MSNFDDIRAMREHYSLPNPVNFDESRIMDDEWLDFRFKLLVEELNEIRTAGNKSDPEELLDGLVDLVVVAMGTAAGLGFNWQTAWDEVFRANMEKTRSDIASDSKRNNTFDLIKPDGWKEPNLLPALNEPIVEQASSICYNIRRMKKQDYQNDSITTSMYFPFGMLSFAQMIHIKSLRLQSLVTSENSAINEPIRDTLLDLINYAQFAFDFDRGVLN